MSRAAGHGLREGYRLGQLGSGSAGIIVFRSAKANPFAERKTITQSPAHVVFDEDTPIGLIETISPDVLVKGGDYTLETIVDRDAVDSYGGRVVIYLGQMG